MDTLVFDMSSQAEGTPQVFVRKDWLSILDNQTGNYQGNQSVLDTSQLANSNKYMNYREGYFLCPLLLTLTQSVGATAAFAPATAGTSADYAIGLKNWYGSIVHSFTLDYNGTTIIQQTPFIGLWNTFKLLTSLSYNDLLTQGPTIGFYPDTSQAVSFSTALDENGLGTTNNQNFGAFPVVSGVFNQGAITNEGFFKRQTSWVFDPQGVTSASTSSATWVSLITASNLNLSYKSYIFNKTSATGGPPTTTAGAFQVAISAIIKLKHLHSFFERVPLLKGVFMRMTLNLNQSSVNFTAEADGDIDVTSIVSPLGGVSPLMIASSLASNGATNCFQQGNYILSLAVGQRCLNPAQNTLGQVQTSPLAVSILLYVPAYTFNPVFETSMLSAPIKKVVYTDLYQYQIVNQITAGQTFNNLITNGIANIKSVLVLPFYTTAGNAGISPIFSPFDPAGGGPTSPLCLLTNFNVQVSGQNAIYNTQRFSFEQFQNQLYGMGAVNGGLTDGLTSGLISQLDFETEYNYYYVNVGRMLPVEESVPKSVNIIGQNLSTKAIDLFVFIEYGVEVSIDILTGARV